MIRPSRKRKFEGKTAEQLLEENEDFKKENNQLIATINNMKYDIQDYDRLKVEYEEQNKILAELFDEGVIDGEGNIIKHSDH